MNNWQYQYAIELLQKGRKTIEDKKEELENRIKTNDKRTYNGKMDTTFAKAELLVVEKLLEI